MAGILVSLWSSTQARISLVSLHTLTYLCFIAVLLTVEFNAIAMTSFLMCRHGGGS